jgi:hypothetical protein
VPAKASHKHGKHPLMEFKYPLIPRQPSGTGQPFASHLYQIAAPTDGMPAKNSLSAGLLPWRNATTASVEPENIEINPADALAYRKASRIERLKGQKADARIPLRAAARGVQELRPELTLQQAETQAQRALAWVRKAHDEWLWAKPGSRRWFR